MSVHGVCFDNGMSGKCDVECEQFTDGDCPEPDEVINGWMEYITAEEQDQYLLVLYNEVELWLLRGEGKLTDKELLRKALYKEYSYNG